MPFLADFYDYSKKHSIIIGVFFSDVITFLTYLLSFGVSLIAYGDIHMVIGTAIGVYFALKHRKQTQNPLYYGVLVGIVGTFLSALTLTLFQWSNILAISIDILVIYMIPALFIGPVIGLIVGVYFRVKKKDKEPQISSEFFDSLKET